MPRTYSQILLHIVFSTKGRAVFIQLEIQARLYDYIGGVIRSEKGTLYAIAGLPPHNRIPMMAVHVGRVVAQRSRSGRFPPPRLRRAWSHQANAVSFVRALVGRR